MNVAQRRRLLELLRLPTAPFREAHIRRFAMAVCTRARIPCFSDSAGNLVIGVADRHAYRRLLAKPDREPVRLFVAHMDHPGFHGVRWRGPSTLSVRWHGGSPTRYLNRARVWIADDDGIVAQGRMTKARRDRAGHAIATAEVQLPISELRERHATDLFGGFSFRAPVWQHGRRLFTKAADDLIGVYAVLETARTLKRRRRRPPFIGLLTRGEEVGFIGAIAHFERERLAQARRSVICVSLETSRTLPGAVIGKGPVVRLGDRRGVFSAEALRVFSDLALKVLPDRHQRRVMDGGTCEATAALAHGLPAIGISVPLGNYHNEGFEGGPDCKNRRGPAPEFVHLDDIDGLLALCRALMRPGLHWDDPWKSHRQRLHKNRRRYAALLKRSLG